MRLVAEAVVSSGRERVETLKPGAVGSYPEHGAILSVAAQSSSAVEKPSCCDQRAARPRAIGSAKRVQNPQSKSGTGAITGRAAGEEYCQRHTGRRESEEVRLSLVSQRKPGHVVKASALNGLGARTVNGKNRRETCQVEQLPNVILHAAQGKLAVGGLKSFGGQKKDAEARAAHVLELGKVDNQPLHA